MNLVGEAMKSNGLRLERFNIVLEPSDSEFLDRLVQEIRAVAGAKVSRSEIVRAAIAGLHELHRLTPEGGPSWLPPLNRCRSGSDLAVVAVLAARVATSVPS